MYWKVKTIRQGSAVCFLSKIRDTGDGQSGALPGYGGAGGTGKVRREARVIAVRRRAAGSTNA